MLGLAELQIAVLLIALIGCIEWLRVRRTGPTLILKEFRVDASARGSEFLYVLGRRSGILAWALSLFGLDSQTSFSVGDQEAARETVGPSGFESGYAPMREISASQCKYYRAFFMLVLSLCFYLYGLLTLLIAMFKANDYIRQSAMSTASDVLWEALICGTLCYVWYARSKRVSLWVCVRGDVVLGISFKPSVVGSTRVELRQAVDAVDLINSRILSPAVAGTTN